MRWQSRPKSRCTDLITGLVLGFIPLVSAKAEVPSFMGLGSLSTIYPASIARSISPDGSVVVGNSRNDSDFNEGFQWTADNGMLRLGFLTGDSRHSFPLNVSNQGSVIVGFASATDPNANFEAFRWTENDGMMGLGHLPGATWSSSSRAVSGDGSVIVGSSASVGSAIKCFRWAQDTGMIDMGYLPGGNSKCDATGVSADGSVIVGYSFSGLGQEAFRWTSANGMIGIGDLAGGVFTSAALAVSGDGAVIVGEGASDLGEEAMRWTETTGMVGLGDLPGGAYDSVAYATSSDGSVVVGYGSTALGQEAFIWDQNAGIRRLHDVLAEDFGLDLTGWFLGPAFGISADGQTIVGSGTDESGSGGAWIAHIPEPSTLLLAMPYYLGLCLQQHFRRNLARRTALRLVPNCMRAADSLGQSRLRL